MMRRAALLILIFIGVFVTLGMVINGSRTIMGTLDFSTATGILRPPFSDTRPPTCTKGDVFFDTNEDTTGSWMLCTATNTWKDTDDDGGAGGSVATDGIWDAKGDIAGATGADTAAALTVGANDTMLMADSTTATGLKWGNAATVKTALSLGSVENTALSTWTGNTAITSTGTVATGTWTSTITLNTAVMTVTNGTAPTVDAAGELAVDTTDAQLVYYSTAKRVIPYEDQACAVLESLVAADDNYEFFMANDAITVTAVGCRCRGTCSTAATFTLEDRGGNAMTITGTNPTCATTGASTYAAVTAGNGLTAGEGLAFDVTNTPTTGDTYTICVTYTTDAQ